MLGVPPKSSGGATNRCVMSRLTKCAVPGPFRTGIESGVPRAVCRSDIGAASAHRPRSGDRSGSMTRAPCAGCPARFPAGLAVTPAFSGSALYGAGRYPSSTVSMGPSLAQGRVDPMRVLVMALLGQDSALSVGWWYLAAHGPTSCFSPTRRGALADLSRCKRLPGIAVNCALVWQQVTAAIGTTSDVLAAGPDNAGYRWLGRPILLPAAPQFSDRHT
jgi:hypothetical protein